METFNVNMNKLSADEQKQLRGLVEKSNKPGLWVPNDGEEYWFLYSDGQIGQYTYMDNPCGCANVAIGNVFRTREDAEDASECLKVRRRWKELSVESGEDDNPWDEKHPHFYAIYDYFHERVVLGKFNYRKFACDAFATKEAIESAIEEIGNDKVKRYILGVREGYVNV